MPDCGTITVVPAFNQSNVTAACPTLPNEVTVGEPFTLEWTIQNANDTAASVSYSVSVGRDTVDSGTEQVTGTSFIETSVVIENVSGSSEDLSVSVEITDAQPV